MITQKQRIKLWSSIAIIITIIGTVIWYSINSLILTPAEKGAMGDLIAGTIGVALSFTSVVLIYMSFIRQDETNKMVELNFHEVRLERSIEKLQNRIGSIVKRDEVEMSLKEAIRLDVEELGNMLNDLPDGVNNSIISNTLTDRITELRTKLHSEAIIEFSLRVINVLKAINYFKEYDFELYKRAIDDFLLMFTVDEKNLFGILYNWGNEQHFGNELYAKLPIVVQNYNLQYHSNVNFKTIPRLRVSVYLPDDFSKLEFELLQNIIFDFKLLSENPVIVTGMGVTNLNNPDSSVEFEIKDAELFIDDKTNYSFKIEQILTQPDLSRLFSLFINDSRQDSINHYGIVFNIRTQQLNYEFNLEISVSCDSAQTSNAKWSIFLTN